MPKTPKIIIAASLACLGLNAYSFQLAIPPELQNKVALSIVDAQNNQAIYNYRESTPLLLASNMKILTSYAALTELGAKFHWTTKLSYQGQIENGILHGNVYLIGGGNPQLSSQDLQQMLAKLKQRGINKIDGDFVYDMSIFNQSIKSSELHPEPLAEYSVDPAGLIIDSNLSNLKLQVKKNSLKFSQQRSLDYKFKNQLKVNNQSKSSCKYPSDYITATPSAQHTIILSGSVPLSCNQQLFGINLLSTPVYNKVALKQILAAQKIKLTGTIIAAKASNNTILVAAQNSADLSEILPKMNKDSNNLYAKSLFMSLGAYKTTNQATYADARQQYIRVFQRKFNFPELANVENGAGLSRTEKISTAHMTQLLGAIYQSPENNYFISTLATPGESGTLQSEFPQFKQKLFAKTGSLSDVKAYSGYFRATNGHTYLISFIANDINATENTTSQLQAFKQLVTAALNQLDTPQ